MEGEVTSMITTALTNVTTVLAEAMEVITGNEVMALYLGIGIVAAGLGLFARGKRAAR